MGLFGNTKDKVPHGPPKLLGREAKDSPTSEFGRCVPYFAGYRRMAGTFITPAFNIHTEPVRRKVGKKKETVGYDYICSFAMVLCIGPVDEIEKITLDDTVVWEGPVTRSTEDYVDITVADRGTVRLYWGTSTQAPDATLDGSGQSHPGYRHQCYAVFTDWNLGLNRTAIGNLEFWLKRQPTPAAFPDAAPINDEVNPLIIAYELLTNEVYGLGMASRVDADDMLAAWQTLQDEEIGVSAYIDDTQKMTSFLAEICGYIGGYIKVTAAGKLSFGLIRNGQTSIATLGVSSFTRPPSVESEQWWDTFNMVSVSFRNVTRNFERDAVARRDSANFAITRQLRTKEVSRDWVSRQQVAWKIAAMIGREEAFPKLTIKGFIKGSYQSSVDVGDVVTVSYPTGGVTSTKFIVESVSAQGPGDAEMGVELSEYRGHLCDIEVIPDEDALLEIDPGEAEPTADTLLLELPYGYTESRRVDIGIIPARPNNITNLARIHQEGEEDVFAFIGSTDSFGLMGELNDDIEADWPLIDGDHTADITFSSSDKTLDDVTETEAEVSHKLLLLIGDEMIWAHSLTLVTTGRYTMKMMRGRYGTRRRRHLTGATVWALPVNDEGFFDRRVSTTPTLQVFKIQPVAITALADLASCPEESITTVQRAFRPQPPANLGANGDTWAATWNSGGDVVLTWTHVSDDHVFAEPEEDPEPRYTSFRLKLYNSVGTYKGEVDIADETLETYTLTNGVITGILGGEETFSVRIFGIYAGKESLDYSAITISLNP